MRFAQKAGGTNRAVTGVAIYCCLDGISDELRRIADDLGRWEAGRS